MHHSEKYQDKNSFQYCVSGTGPKILLLNGAIMGFNGWDPVRKELEKNYTVIGLDFPNQGNEKLDLHYSNQIDYALFAADFLNVMNWDSKEITVIGLSFGANIARIMGTELAMPFKKVILTGSTPPSLFSYMNLFQEHLIKLMDKGGIELFAHEMALRLFSTGFLSNNPQLPKMIYDRFNAAFSQRPLAIKTLLQASLNYRKTEKSSQEKWFSPVYVISSKDDMMVPHSYALEYSHSIQADGFYEIQAGHLPFAEALADYNKVLLEILRK